MTALIFIMLLGFALYLTSAADTPLTFPLVAVLAALSFLCVLAAAGGIGLLALRPHGRAILMVFASLELVLFPLGTVLSIFLFWYFRKREIKSLFTARPAARSLNLKVLLGVALASALLLGAILSLVEFRGRRPGSHQSNPAVAYQPFAIWILTEDGRLSIPDRSSTVTERDIADIGVAQDETGAASVWLKFTEEGASKMRELTRNHLGQRIVFMVDGAEYREQSAVIQSEISEDASITFNSMDEANAFLNKLRKRQ
ncbi:MAG: hypothetical protein ABFD92_07405 [Planctomycetaceae bacterium]|nr:hypothetical protein [Planctomycetaceae bacterium]